MPHIELIADFLLSEYLGGAEMVDNNIATYLNTIIHKANVITDIKPNIHYLLTNATSLSKPARDLLIQYKNYSIFEHDYKIHPRREPHYYKDNLFPIGERINLDLFCNAKNVFVQTLDHLTCYQNNTKDISINFVNLSTSIWSQEELNSLDKYRKEEKITHRFAICDNPFPLKGKDQAIQWCQYNNIDYSIIPRTAKETFYLNLSMYPALVSIPIRKESYCRLVVEARCLNLNVITQKTYGAVLEPWFKKSGQELTDFLREASLINITKIKELCE